VIVQRQAVLEPLAAIERHFDTLTVGDSDRAFSVYEPQRKSRHRDVGA
jgi:hypothetical protein